ncbi:type II secretion system protein M [Vibrio sp. SCSIO 43136]|uniref:type II secretion system protein M n=1 Tax=Vibrio sp. SCSIO 43136 TaxID=2819101 RepID=UPI0020765DE9|nr:type II secretion system protein M [Vibrio sp. SCSIO 43136]USD65180.1 type II secretion system protein M [Vibrio sp. SCSIO 43136]
MNQILAWWQSISVREQRLVIIAGALCLVGSLYWGVVAPLNQRAELAQQRIQSEKQLLTWVQDSANTITSLRKSAGVSGSRGSSPLNQVVSSTTRQYKIELIRMQPRGDSLQVWVKPLPFNQLVNWVSNMREKQGIEVEFLDITRTEQVGQVEVNRLQLKRGG